MMTNQQYLLMKLSEECVEVAQMAMKTMAFGASEIMQGQPLTNNQRLHSELNDLMASIQMLNNECGFEFGVDEDAVKRKIDKVNHYRNYCRTLGTVE